MAAAPAAAPVLAAPVRTPTGKFGGRLARLTAADLGTAAASACHERAGLPVSAVDQVVFGHARRVGGGPKTGPATLCVSGGTGLAALVQREAA